MLNVCSKKAACIVAAFLKLFVDSSVGLSGHECQLQH